MAGTDKKSDATVVKPGKAASVPPSANEAVAPPPADRTIVLRKDGPPPPASGESWQLPARVAPKPPAPEANEEPLGAGMVLADMFRIFKRIDSGGMGRVWEAFGVHDHDRVAIKTILPELASDPVALEMFKQEAGRLTRIEHPAIAPYRGFFKDSALGIFFIVMKYINGSNLADVLSSLRPSVADVIHFGRRMAEGLEAAHAIGSIHCDVKPRNILLESGQLLRARLIDFGIGHDVAGDGGPIGDGFAGTYSFAAPEQFDRALGPIGPWTDEYSLGLVLLALLRGHNVDMGGDHDQALAARRAGPDLTTLPKDLRAVIARMTNFDPKARYGSMVAVSQALAKCTGKEPAVDPGALLGRMRDAVAPLARLPTRTLLLAGGGAAVAIVAVLLLLPGSDLTGPADEESALPVAPTSPAEPVEQRAKRLLATTIANRDCSWVDGTVTPAGAGVQIALRGAAPNWVEVQQSVEKAFKQSGIAIAGIDTQLLEMDQRDCLTIDTLRAFQDQDSNHIRVERQSTWEIGKQQQSLSSSSEGIDIYAAALLQLTMADPSRDFALLAVSQGGVSLLAESRVMAETDPNGTKFITRQPNDSFQIKIPAIQPSQWAVVLITGTAPFPAEILSPPNGQIDAAWGSRFSREAEAKGWRTEAAWFAAVNEVPD